MDILLILYSILLASILCTPFLYIRFNGKILSTRNSELKSTLDSERKMLLENLKDLKTEMDTGKIQVSEFSELSEDIIANLKTLDEKIKSVKAATPSLPVVGTCSKCNFYTPIVGAKFCAMCGSSLSG